MDKLGEKVRARRLELGMSLSALASKSGVARSYLYQVERGESVPTFLKAQALAGALNLTMADMADEPSNDLMIDTRIALHNLCNAVTNGVEWRGSDEQKANVATALAHAYLVLAMLRG